MTKIYYITILLALILLGCARENKSSIKHEQIITKYTELKQIVSEEVDDTFFVYIRLPKNYNEENKRYPVLYLLDGDISFNMAVSIVRYLQFGKEVPDLIIAAPAYGTLISDDEVNYRERDYTISPIERFKDSGGAENYLRFLKNELIPFVDSNYRTDDFRVINGYSLGGLFTINLLIEEPSLFNCYIAGSPYLTDDISELTGKIENIQNFEDEKKLFLSVGEYENNEQYHQPINQIITKFGRFNELDIKFRTFTEGTHFSSPSQALTFGLKFSFEE